MPRKVTIESCHQLAKKRGGKCLSTKYINNNTHLEWKCANPEHESWWATQSSIKQGFWCPKCGGNAKITNKDVEKLWKERKWIPLEKIVSCITQIRTQCSQGHRFGISYDKAQQDRGCPICNKSESMGERTCRLCFERFLNIDFRKERPLWLTSIKGTRLELDGYNKELCLAFEYNGKQHYKPVGYCKNEEDLKRCKETDKLKERFCNKNGIELLVVPYTISFEKIPFYIANWLENFGFSLETKPEDIDLTKIHDTQKLEKLIKAGLEQGVKVIADVWLGTNVCYPKICLECGEHSQTSGSNILRGEAGCYACRARARGKERRRKSGEKFKKFLKPLNFELVDKEFKGVSEKATIRCLICNYIFKRQAGSMTYRKTTSCPGCEKVEAA